MNELPVGIILEREVLVLITVPTCAETVVQDRRGSGADRGDDALMSPGQYRSEEVDMVLDPIVDTSTGVAPRGGADRAA